MVPIKLKKLIAMGVCSCLLCTSYSTFATPPTEAVSSVSTVSKQELATTIQSILNSSFNASTITSVKINSKGNCDVYIQDPVFDLAFDNPQLFYQSMCDVGWQNTIVTPFNELCAAFTDLFSTAHYNHVIVTLYLGGTSKANSGKYVFISINGLTYYNCFNSLSRYYGN